MASLNPQRVGGGVAGLGGTVAARQALDDPGDSRFRQPSVLYGLGTGVLAGALWFTDVNTPVVTDDFWASHAATALPTGLLYAVFPKKQGKTTVDQVREAIGGSMGGNGSNGATTQRVTTERHRNGEMQVERTRTGRAR